MKYKLLFAILLFNCTICLAQSQLAKKGTITLADNQVIAFNNIRLQDGKFVFYDVKSGAESSLSIGEIKYIEDEQNSKVFTNKSVIDKTKEADSIENNEAKRNKEITKTAIKDYIVQGNYQNQVKLLNAGILGSLIYSLGDAVMPQYGFLPGSKFPIYPTTKPFDFKKIKMRVTLSDDRKALNLTNVGCSEIELKNKSEFNGDQGTVKVWQYLNELLAKSNIIVDSTATKVLEIHLKALDSRLLGFGQIAVHGICEMEFKYEGISKEYCTDIEDGDRNAPLSKSSYVTRKTASRYMTSASIRETIEKFLDKLLQWK